MTVPVFRGMFLILLLSFAPAIYTVAQPRSEGVAVGGQVGIPSGLSAQLIQEGQMDLNFLLGCDLENFLYLSLHGTTDGQIDANLPVQFSFGPGGFLGIVDRPAPREDRIGFGLSGTAGLTYPVDRLQFFIRIVPRLQLLPDITVGMGAGVGIQYELLHLTP